MSARIFENECGRDCHEEFELDFGDCIDTVHMRHDTEGGVLFGPCHQRVHMFVPLSNGIHGRNVQAHQRNEGYKKKGGNARLAKV